MLLHFFRLVGACSIPDRQKGTVSDPVWRCYTEKSYDGDNLVVRSVLVLILDGVVVNLEEEVDVNE